MSYRNCLTWPQSQLWQGLQAQRHLSGSRLCQKEASFLAEPRWRFCRSVASGADRGRPVNLMRSLGRSHAVIPLVTNGSCLQSKSAQSHLCACCSHTKRPQSAGPPALKSPHSVPVTDAMTGQFLWSPTRRKGKMCGWTGRVPQRSVLWGLHSLLRR